MYFWPFQQPPPLKPKGKVVSLLGFYNDFSETTPSSSWGNILFSSVQPLSQKFVCINHPTF